MLGRVALRPGCRVKRLSSGLRRPRPEQPSQLPYWRPRVGPWVGHSPVSTASFTRNIAQRTVSYFERYPFVKYSILLCVTVLGASIAVESYAKHKKKQQPQILSLPPQVGHATLPRPAEVDTLWKRVRRLQKRGLGVLYIVGPSGAGKTELVCQYGKHFIEQTLNITHRFRISKPPVLYLNGSSCEQLQNSLQEAALSLGMQESSLQPQGREGEELLPLARAVQQKLAANKVPWLIVVDHLTPVTQPAFVTLFHAGAVKWNWSMGHVVVTTQDAAPEEGGECVVHIDRMLKPTDSLSLLRKISPSTDFPEAPPASLSVLLQSSPLALALAAATVNLFSASLEREAPSESCPPALTEYLAVLEEQLSATPTPDEVSAACLSLYLEAAATEPRMLHTFDLLGAVDPTGPVPAALVTRHLSSPFYGLPPEPPTPPESVQEEPSFLSQLKQLLPFGNKTPTPALPSLTDGHDLLHFLRDCPLIAFKKYSKGEFEYLQVHSTAAGDLSQVFLKRTVPKMEHAHLAEAEEKFHRTAWFKQYRKFDAEKSLGLHHSSLPGVAAPGVLTREQFLSGSLTEAGQLQYSQYLHLVSHRHRVLSSITAQLKTVDDDFASTQFCRYTRHHLNHLLHSGTLSKSDHAMCSYGLAFIASVTSCDAASTLALYRSVLEEQRSVLGPQHPTVARTLTDMADLLFSLGDTTGARDLLESALQLYRKTPPQARGPDHDLELGLTMSSLAVVASALGEKVRSRDLLENALSLYQSVPAGETVSLHQRRLVASTLTDLAHAYLTLGSLIMAQKYIELSVMAQPTIYPEGSQETVRAFSVASLVYSLLGDQGESRRVRDEAGKVQKKIEKEASVHVVS